MFIRTDDSDAFGQEPILKINFAIPENQSVSKAIVLINKEITLEYNFPNFPLGIHLNSKQSSQLKDDNCIDLILYDENGKQYSIPCVAHFKTGKEVL